MIGAPRERCHVPRPNSVEGGDKAVLVSVEHGADKKYRAVTQRSRVRGQVPALVQLQAHYHHCGEAASEK